MKSGPVWFYLLGWVWTGGEWRIDSARSVLSTWEDALEVLNPFRDKYGRTPGEAWRGADGLYRSGRVYYYDAGSGTWADWKDPAAGGWLGELVKGRAAGVIWL